ncbi:hypothetical protein PVAND_013259 [Polypedilum vanderplanki]|uniref:Zinc finger HIT domain-containing protein 3 n=1 Tax=Polypedilum vanderplanki TaxID=319348 RepID=A0A9J6CQW5_POLVA|nr:hypothetical protein PVAND_013259 [Polypedilum vanderplanki]
MTSCNVCEKQNHKYTCPKCFIKYCSLPCFKEHKISQCEEIQKKNQFEQPKYIEDKIPEKINLFETIDTVSQQKLEELANSEKIKQLLLNPHLRKFLKDVNNDRNSWKAMKVAMTEPLFLEFADECLKIVES